jgi:hypothetical protein
MCWTIAWVFPELISLYFRISNIIILSANRRAADLACERARLSLSEDLLRRIYLKALVSRENDARRRWFASMRQGVAKAMAETDIRMKPGLAEVGDLRVCFCEAHGTLMYVSIYTTYARQIMKSETLTSVLCKDGPGKIAAAIARDMVDGQTMFCYLLRRDIYANIL